MKKLEKISLANIKGKLTRKEMKNIMAGSGGDDCCAILPGCPTFKWCGLTSSEAENKACSLPSGAYWCCGSC